MLGAHWFTFPVWDGVELVIDSPDTEIQDHALADFVAHYADYNLLYEWETDGGVIIKFVPAPDAVTPEPEPTQIVAPKAEKVRVPQGKGRRIPRQSGAA